MKACGKNTSYSQGSERINYSHDKKDTTASTPKSREQDSETAYIRVKSTHILSMMEEKETFIYGAKPHKIGEVAYQLSKVEHKLGTMTPSSTKYNICKMGKKQEFVKN